MMRCASFRRWVLGRTKFSDSARAASLLHDEQAGIRPRKFWWRHWWTTISDIQAQREVDIFLVFEASDGNRFALLVENKLLKSSFQPGQAESYAMLGKAMMGRPEFLAYSNYETVLLAPEGFRTRNIDRCGMFDRFLSHEEVGLSIPEFRPAS